MNRTETAKCYALAAGAYEMEPSATTIEAWHLLLADLDGDAALAATKRLCQRDTPFPPRPGEIVAEVARLTGDELPSLDAAVGFYLAGEWDRHPAIRAAASRVQWDRNGDKAQAAVWEFRSYYSAAMHAEESGRPLRAVGNGDGPQRIGAALFALPRGDGA